MKTRLIAQAVVLIALGVALAPFTSFPIGIARVNPTQHFINVIAAVLLGPWWATGIAGMIAILRISLGVGTILAFPGGMIGALLAGLIFRARRNMYLAALGEVIGTGIIAALVSGLWVAPVFMQTSMALNLLIASFLSSTALGSAIALVVLKALERAGVVRLPGKEVASLSQIVVRDVSYRYPQAAQWTLRRLNLSIDAGEYVVLCGASGSGKSTLCRVLTGLIPHVYEGSIEGTILVDGLDTREQSPADVCTRIGLVFQHPQWQLFNSTVTREIAFGLESLGYAPAEIWQRIGDVSSWLGIEHLLARHPQQLSTGEQLLVALASILAMGARIVVLDEPLANLDGRHVAQVRAILRRLHRQGVTIIVAEHRLGLVAADATRIIVLHDGQVVLDGPPVQVLTADIQQFHLEPPLPVQIGRALNLTPLPLTVEAVLAQVAHHHLATMCPLPPDTPRSPGGSPLLSVHDLSFTVGQRRVLTGVHLDLYADEGVAIVGANGAGKTSLIKHFNGLYRPQQGQVRVIGKDLRTTPVSVLARHVGMVFQNPDDQLFTTRVRDEVAVGARIMGVYDPEQVAAVLRTFQLEHLADRSPFTLSAGEKRRLTLAAALVTNPAILVLDEPTTGLDWPARQALARYLREQVQHGRTVVVVTHDLEFADMLTSHWFVLADGRLLTEGSPYAICTQPAVVQAADLLLPDRYRLALALQHVPVEAGGRQNEGEV